MLKTKRASWWSHMSLINQNEKVNSLDTQQLIKKTTTYENVKHTFFPGSEASRNRLRLFSKILIDVDSSRKLLWDTIIMITAIYLSFKIPYSVSFFSDSDVVIWYYVSILFGIDIILSFNTTFYYEGNLINTRKKIAENYMKSTFFMDLLSGFPFEFFILDVLNFNETQPRYFRTEQEYMRLILLLKLFKLHKLPKLVYQYQIHYPQSFMYSIVNIFNYLLLAAFPAHWMTCLYNTIYCYNLEHDYIYWDRAIIPNYSRYVRFIERVIQTMTSVGYGDYTVLSPYERVLTIMFMSITSGLLGIFVGAIHLAIEKSSENTIYFRKIMQEFIIFMNKHKIPKALRMRISNYIRHLKFSYNNNLLKEEDIIKMISLPLREQIFLYTRGYVLIKVPQFQDLSTGCLKSLGYKMNLNFYAPEDLIMRQGEYTCDIYFIFSGLISVFHEQTETTFITLGKGKYFGEIAFFQNQGRSASIKSKNFSEIFSLSRYSFDDIIRSIPRDFEKIQTLQRNLNTYGISYLGTACYLCKIRGHLAKDCSKSIWKPDMQQIMLYSRIRRGAVGAQGSKHHSAACNMLNDYSKIRTTGFPYDEKLYFKERKYLSRKIMQFNYSVKAIGHENLKLFTLINELSSNKKANDAESEESNESNESEKNFLNFSVTRVEKRPSFLVTSENISFFPNSE